MSLSKIKDFIVKHRKKFIIGGLFVTGSILFTKFLQQKIKDYQEKEVFEFLERTRKQQHFETINRTCNQTILNLSSSLYESVNKVIDTERLISELRTNPGEKFVIWNNLNILLFAKLSCFIYGLTILLVTLRVQLNIVGGYLFKEPNSIDAGLQEKYLGIIQNFISKGLTTLAVQAIETSRKVANNMDMKKQMRISDIDALFWKIQNSIASENKTIENLKNYVLPIVSITDDEKLNSLISETGDLLDSEEVKSLVSQCVTKGFLLFGDQISEFYGTENETLKFKSLDENNVDSLEFDTKKPLAKVLPIINGLLNKNSFPDKFVQQLVINDKLQILAANIYESFL